MSTRFGTPTGRHGSGTEKEFKDALKKWNEAGTPWVTFYFDDAPRVSRKPEEAEQYVKVCKFRKRLESKGIVGTYTGVSNEDWQFASHRLRKELGLLLPADEDSPDTLNCHRWYASTSAPRFDSAAPTVGRRGTGDSMSTTAICPVRTHPRRSRKWSRCSAPLRMVAKRDSMRRS